MDRLRDIFDQLLDADVRTRERILDDVHRDNPDAAERLRKMIAATPAPLSTLGLWKKLPQALEEAPQLEEGERLDDFRVLAPLGSGGLAAVYLAVDEHLGRRVALKVSRSTGKEPRLLAKLPHPGIVQAYRAFRHSEKCVDVLVLQYVEGVTLDEALRGGCFHATDAGQKLDARLEERWGRRASDGLDREEATAALRRLDTTNLALRVAADVAEALSFAHGRGVLHLDVKPSNIFLDRGGRAILGDFNVGTESTGDQRAWGGTPGYMAPEQFAGKAVDARSDVFALGRVVAALFSALPAEAWPRGLAEWLEAATDPSPDRRPPTVADGAARLGEIARWHRLEVEEASSTPWLVALARRMPLGATFVAAIVPNALMSALQILYNRIHIVDVATPAQQEVFRAVVGPWNLFVFSLGGYLMWWRFAPIRTLPPLEALRRATSNVVVGGAIASLGWLMGCALFIAAMGLGAPPLADALTEHFVLSFLLAAGLCAAYAAQALTFVAAAAWLPLRYRPEQPSVVAAAQWEARRLADWMRALTVACAALPLVGAAVIVWQGPGMKVGKAAYPFQALVLLALVFSGVGFTLASRLALWTRRALARYQRS